jgi:hypothetical protein
MVVFRAPTGDSENLRTRGYGEVQLQPYLQFAFLTFSLRNCADLNGSAAGGGMTSIGNHLRMCVKEESPKSGCTTASRNRDHTTVCRFLDRSL